MNCIICHSDRRRIIYDMPPLVDKSQSLEDYYATVDRFNRYGTIVKCSDCGLVYTESRPDTATITHGYQNAEDLDYTSESAGRSINAYFSLHTIKKHISGGRLLDVGCATGYFLNAARTDFDVQGVELSKWAAEHARSRFKFPVHQGDLASARFPDGNFDAVTMIDVIEHVPDPVSLVREANRVLRKDGVLYLVTPDIDSLSAKVMRSRWWGLRPAHIYYFSPATISRLLKDAGFSVVQTKSFGRIFTYQYWLSRLKNYPAPVYRAAGAFVRGLGLEDKFVYLDTRDSMQIIARKI